MASFVPRQRKRKARQRSETRKHGKSGDDSNALEIALPTTEREKQKQSIKGAIRAEQPKMSNKKQKRLDKYIVGSIL